MATTQAFTTFAGISRKIGRILPRQVEFESIQTVEGLSWLRLFLSCPRHEWAWPLTNREERVKGFDAHQTCFKCASRRLFNSKDWLSGPIYRSHSRHRG